jgi:hypothetical protein
MMIQQIIKDKIIKNLLMIFGIFLILSGVNMAIDFHTNSELQKSIKILKQEPDLVKIISFGENLMIGGYVTLLIGGIIITITGYIFSRYGEL